MKLTMGEFCQFSINTRFELLKEFGKTVTKKKVRMNLVSVYEVFGFYVEVYENLDSRSLEKVEPVKSIGMLGFYNGL